MEVKKFLFMGVFAAIVVFFSASSIGTSHRSADIAPPIVGSAQVADLMPPYDPSDIAPPIV